MGQTCKTCSGDYHAPNRTKTNISEGEQIPLSIIEDWGPPVKNLSLPGIRNLLFEDCDLINKPIDISGQLAIHYVTKKKHFDILTFLIDKNANINAKHPKTGNTALHIAVQQQWLKGIRLLFDNNANDEITNRQNKKPIDLITLKNCKNPKQFRKKYKKAKKLKKDKPLSIDIINSNELITISGVPINSHAFQLISVTNKDKTEKNNYYTQKIDDIKKRKDVASTDFGDAIGCDIDEIGYVLQRIKNKDKLWKKYINGNKTNDFKKIKNIIIVLTMYALKMKQDRIKGFQFNKMLDHKQINSLTLKIMSKLKNKKLYKKKFCKDFFQLFYEIHDELLTQEYTINEQ